MNLLLLLDMAASAGGDRVAVQLGEERLSAAELLGISLKTLYNKLAKYGIQAVKSARLT